VTPVIAAENNKLVNEAKDNACEGKDLNDDNLMKNEDDKSGSRLQKPENDNNNNNYEVKIWTLKLKIEIETMFQLFLIIIYVLAI